MPLSYEWCSSGISIGTALVAILVGNMNSDITCTFCKIANNTTLCSWCAGGKGCHPETPWQDWEVGPCECHEVQQGQGNHRHKYRMGGERIESSPEQKDLGMLVDEKKLNMTQSYALTAQIANCMLGWIHSSVTSRMKEGILRFYLALETAHLEYCVQISEAPRGEGHGPTGMSPQEAIKMIRGLEYHFYESRLREFGMFSLANRRFWQDLTVTLQYSERAYKCPCLIPPSNQVPPHISSLISSPLRWERKLGRVRAKNSWIETQIV